METLLDQGPIVVDLNGSHTVYADGIDELILTPEDTHISNELTAGISEVGKDIEPGSYSIALEEGDAAGYLEIFEEGESPKVFEVLVNPLEPDIDVTLREGQKIRISGLYHVLFEPQS